MESSRRGGFAVAAGCALGLAAGVLAARGVRAESLAPTPVEVLRSDLQGVSGQEVIVTTTDWEPGRRLPLHVHPGGHEFAFVTEGELTFEVEGQGTTTVRAGQVHHVLPGVAHFGRNDGKTVARTIVFRVKDKSQPVSVPVPVGRGATTSARPGGP